jgi:phosphoglucomutase
MTSYREKEKNEKKEEKNLEKTLSAMILSPSGWRGVFAEHEESAATEISAGHRIIAAAAARVFADFLSNKGPPDHADPDGTDREGKTVILGMDTRPTGGAIADAMIRSFLAQGCEVRFAGITAAPELMAYARHCGKTRALGFVYISASHNPIGHNGFKFGRADGGVLAPEESLDLIDKFRAFLSSGAPLAESLSNRPLADPEHVYADMPRIKEEAYRVYLDFTREVVMGNSGGILSALRDPGCGLAIVADFNGSARTLSIDREFFSSLGIRLYAMNDKPGQIAHRIVPEGESLEPCCRFLEEQHRQDPSALLGYVPDCDGDRGNLVIWDGNKARSLEAQEVFALACVSELSHLVWTGETTSSSPGKIAVAVNDPTSLRVDSIAAAFGASVFRAEVGEANVVGLARKLRDQGYTVRILGEGSAGGNITHPSAVRDPIHTVMALVKLFNIRGDGERPGFFDIWRERSGASCKGNASGNDFSLSDIIASLPRFVTTGSYTPEAKLQVRTRDHGLLKGRYQEVFLREWEARREELRERYGIGGWEAAAYIGMEEKRGLKSFAEAGRGGLKVLFTDAETSSVIAWIWMRGSGTEPVFRVMAEGKDERTERDLIQWQRRMVLEADRSV